MTTRIMLVAAALITGLVVGYNLNKPSSPEIRRAIAVTGTEPEVRRAIPVEPEVRRAIPVHKEEPAGSANDVAQAYRIIDADADDDDDELAVEESDQNEESDPYYVPRINLWPASASTPVYPDTGYVPVTRAYAESRYEPSDIPKNYTVLHPDGTASFIYGHGDNATVLNPDGTASFIYGHGDNATVLNPDGSASFIYGH